MRFLKLGLSVLVLVMLCFSLPSVGVFGNFASAASSSCTVGSEPSNLAFNPSDNYIGVSFGYTTDTISFVASPCSVVSSTPAIAGCPFDMAYNPTNQLVYVLDSCNNSIVLLQGTTVMGTITNAAIVNPHGIIFDPIDNLMFVGVQYGMIALSGTTVSKSISLSGYTPTALAYSSASKEIFAITGGGSTVEIIGESCFCITGHVDLKVGATGLAYDSSNSYIYVSGYSSSTPNRAGMVNVISSSSHSIVATIGTGRHTNDVAYSPTTNEVYASNFLPTKGSTSVSIIKGLTVSKTLNLKGAPDQLVYDPSNGLVYASLWSSGKLTTVNS